MIVAVPMRSGQKTVSATHHTYNFSAWTSMKPIGRDGAVAVSLGGESFNIKFKATTAANPVSIDKLILLIAKHDEPVVFTWAQFERLYAQA